MPQKGKQSICYATRPAIWSYAAVAGKKEHAGPLGQYFDYTSDDTYFGQKTWEKAENRMQQLALETALEKGGLEKENLGVVFSGDLLNQCIGSSFSLRGTGIPTLGLYGACSTMAEGLLLAGAAVDGRYARRAAALTSSHFASSERQYRNPLGYGAQRTPTAQWTVTGAGCMIVTREGSGPYLEAATVGSICDLGIKDANQMGAAMAPAAYDTLTAHFRDLDRTPQDYDLIVTGDLGKIGRQIVLDFFQRDGVKLENYDDCGCLIFDLPGQDVHAGGSGCGCSASCALQLSDGAVSAEKTPAAALLRNWGAPLPHLDEPGRVHPRRVPRRFDLRRQGGCVIWNFSRHFCWAARCAPSGKFSSTKRI